MLMFWLVAALFLAGALLFLLPPLLRPRLAGLGAAQLSVLVHRDQWREAKADVALGLLDASHQAEVRADLERRLLEDAGALASAASGAPPPPTPPRPAGTARPAHRIALALALLLPLCCVLAYLQLGRPDAVPPSQRPTAAATATRHALTPEQIQQMAASLAERLKAQPRDAEGWLMLARSYTALARYRDAAGAFRKAIELLPPNANLLADLADVTGMAQGKRLAGEPARHIQTALDLDPRHVKALALAGSVAFEARDYATARSYWERLVAVLPPDAPMLRGIRGSIAEASRLEGSSAGPPAAADSGAASAAAATSVHGEVTVSPALAAQLAPGDTLFVLARAAEGLRVPLAVQRFTVGGQTRFAFALDDGMAMGPNLKLSAFARVVVSARVSRSGQAALQGGDLLGSSEPVAPGATGVKVVIDRVQP
ncbi:MAG: c-type cytochrome biogenesis protein CcmI [Rubrivivax sp.]|nr:c-type cytochrome biogenesis protein CcmI [Rubrivivax sp.]